MPHTSLRHGLLAATSVTALALTDVLFPQPAHTDVTNGGFESGSPTG